MTALIPRSLQPFCTLSYPVPANVDGRHVTLYDKGINDVYFVIGVAIGLTALRHLLMMWVFYPIGRLVVPLPALESHKGQSASATVKQKRSQDRKHHHNLVRFAEQAWSLGYCTFTWTLSTVRHDDCDCGRRSRHAAACPWHVMAWHVGGAYLLLRWAGLDLASLPT